MITKHLARMLVNARDLHPINSNPFDDGSVNPEYTRGQADLIMDTAGSEVLVKEEVIEFISHKTDTLPVYLKPGHVVRAANISEAD